jgi:hypothetical protein
MNRYRSRLPLLHPLVEVFFAAIQSVTTSMSDSSKGRYRTTTEYFLHYLNQHHPGVRTLDQLRRDPHILGWLTCSPRRNHRWSTVRAPCMSSLCAA